MNRSPPCRADSAGDGQTAGLAYVDQGYTSENTAIAAAKRAYNWMQWAYDEKSSSTRGERNFLLLSRR